MAIDPRLDRAGFTSGQAWMSLPVKMMRKSLPTGVG